jgi:hypothetical protein
MPTPGFRVFNPVDLTGFVASAGVFLSCAWFDP